METKMTIENALQVTGELFANPTLKLSQQEHLILIEAYKILKEFIETNTKKE